MEPRNPWPPVSGRPAPFLPPLAWIAGGVCAFAPLAGALRLASQGALTGSFAFMALSVAAGLLLLPASLAWAVWRWVGRGQTVVFALSLGVSVVLLGLHGYRRDATQRELLTSEAKVLADNLIHRSASPRAPLVSGPISDARRAVKARFDATRLVYDVAVEGVDPARFFELTALTFPEMITARRAQVAAFAKANDLLHDASSMGAFYFTSELRDRGLSEEAVRIAVDAYRAATKRVMPRLKRLRDQDDALVMLMHQYLDFAESQQGRWRLSGADLHFADPVASARHTTLQITARALLTERDRALAALR